MNAKCMHVAKYGSAASVRTSKGVRCGGRLSVWKQFAWQLQVPSPPSEAVRWGGAIQKAGERRTGRARCGVHAYDRGRRGPNIIDPSPSTRIGLAVRHTSIILPELQGELGVVPIPIPMVIRGRGITYQARDASATRRKTLRRRRFAGKAGAAGYGRANFEVQHYYVGRKSLIAARSTQKSRTENQDDADAKAKRRDPRGSEADQREKCRVASRQWIMAALSKHPKLLSSSAPGSVAGFSNLERNLCLITQAGLVGLGFEVHGAAFGGPRLVHGVRVRAVLQVLNEPVEAAMILSV
ncbi:hypothetical protein EIP86_004297 [Pleurotus ostreatoroseus]|nr:hypothetical protein EIP86_004297 [Pleurotus ostreatoroseus]